MLMMKRNFLLSLLVRIEIYEDNDNAKEDEIAALGGQTATGTNVFSAFYDRLKENLLWFNCFYLREYHRRHLAALVVDANEGHEALLKEEPQVKFSGEVETEFEEQWAEGKVEE
ncbi:hypothetical protein M0R45_000317 [Rubus argutus]|uniref:Uncharacterized protein n=1 Tax=Rubus argutus TaxID=59490 RepID=A0AAW1VL30_RUBAR